MPLFTICPAQRAASAVRKWGRPSSTDPVHSIMMSVSDIVHAREALKQRACANQSVGPVFRNTAAHHVPEHAKRICHEAAESRACQDRRHKEARRHSDSIEYSHHD